METLSKNLCAKISYKIIYKFTKRFRDLLRTRVKQFLVFYAVIFIEPLHSELETLIKLKKTFVTSSGNEVPGNIQLLKKSVHSLQANSKLKVKVGNYYKDRNKRYY